MRLLSPFRYLLSTKHMFCVIISRADHQYLLYQTHQKIIPYYTKRENTKPSQISTTIQMKGTNRTNDRPDRPTSNVQIGKDVFNL